MWWCCRMPAKPCQRRAAAWCLLLCLASSAPGQADAKSDTNHGRPFRPSSLSSSRSLLEQLGVAKLENSSVEALAEPDVYADQAPLGAASNHNSQNGSRSGQALLSTGLLSARSSRRRRSLLANGIPRRLLAESGGVSPGNPLAPTPSPGEWIGPKPCASCYRPCVPLMPFAPAAHAMHAR